MSKNNQHVITPNNSKGLSNEARKSVNNAYNLEIKNLDTELTGLIDEYLDRLKNNKKNKNIKENIIQISTLEDEINRIVNNNYLTICRKKYLCEIFKIFLGEKVLSSFGIKITKEKLANPNDFFEKLLEKVEKEYEKEYIKKYPFRIRIKRLQFIPENIKQIIMKATDNLEESEKKKFINYLISITKKS